jgi:hypothetical protein
MYLQYTGPHNPFDLHHKFTIRHQPNTFLKTLLPIQEGCMSQHQMSLYLKLLPIPSILKSSPVCPCRRITKDPGSFGPTAFRCIFSLADLETRQHESLLARQGLPPLDPSACSQFRAICYRQSSAHIGHAVAKASVMRLLGFLVFLCHSLFLLSLLGTALDQQILSLLLFLSAELPPLDPFPPLRLPPLPLPLFHDSPLSLDALLFRLL